MNIANVEVGVGQPCRFIAEISNNHNGSIYLAKRLITAAKRAGADFVKFQAYTPQELVELRGDGPAPEPWGSEGYTMRTLYEKARTPLEWFPALFEYAAQTGIVAFSSVFGIESLAALEDVGAPAYKIAHQEAHQRALLETVALTEKPMIVSLRAPVSWIMDTVAATLYCPGEYPCAAEDVHLPEFGMPGFVGLSSHCRGIELPIAAVARGCKLIEMHFELAEAPSELESNVSLNQHEFGNMVNGVRNTEVLLA